MKRIVWLALLLLGPGGVYLQAREIVLKDPLGCEWKNELVAEEVAFNLGEFPGTKNIQLLGADGKPVTSQVSDEKRNPDGSMASCKIWFITNVPAGGESRYEIRFGKAAAQGEGVTIQRLDDHTAKIWTPGRANGGVQIPLGEETYDWPMDFPNALSPVQSLILPNGKSVGASQVNAPSRLKSWKSEILEEGPLFVRTRTEYVFETGYWRMEMTVRANTPMVEVIEEFNNGDSGKTFQDFDRFFHLALAGKDYNPTQGWFTGRSRSEQYRSLLAGLAPKSWEQTGALPPQPEWRANPVNGYVLPLESNLTEYGLTGWPTATQNVGNFYRVVEPGGYSIGLASLDPMEWKEPMAIRIGTDSQGKMEARLPIQQFKQGWSIDGFGGGSPNYTGITLFTPPGTARRNYGIMVSPAEDEVEARLESLIGAAAAISGDTLDKVRKWIFKWPDSVPIAKMAAQGTAQAEKALAIMRGRRDLHRIAGYYDSFSMGNHFYFAKRIFPLLEPVMKNPQLATPEQREELRRLLAYEAYRQNSGASFPYGSGLHLNNPNMTIMAVEAKAKSAGLVGDHPEAPNWRKVQLGLMTDFFKRFTLESGAPFENPHYTLGVTLNWAATANQYLLESGAGDALDSPSVKQSIQFMFNWLTPPDPRFYGYRMVLPLGNSSYESVPPLFGEQYAEYYKSRDPLFAEQVQWFANATLPDKDRIRVMPQDTIPDLKSGWWKDYGVAFRHGFGTDYETLMFLVAGKAFGHYESETDQMAYTLFAKGQPISLHFGNGYFPMFIRPWLRNRISFDMKMEASERNRIEIETASFQREADYVRATRETDLLKDRGAEYPKLDDKKAWSKEEADDFTKMTLSDGEKIPLTIWSRQMAFIKDSDPAGPNYFVLRDSFEGRPTKPTQLNMWFLSKGMKRDGNVFHFDGQAKVDVDVFVSQPEVPEISTGRYGHAQKPSGRQVGFDPQYHPDGKLGEYQDLLRITQKPGANYLVVLYPRLKGRDPAAAFTRLDHDTVKVETETSTDVIYLGSTLKEVEVKDWKITGRAFTIRLYKDGRKLLVNLEGECRGQLGTTAKIDGMGAFTVTVKDGKASVTEKTAKAEVTLK